jgi:5-methylcytosine-specific restriction protein A
MADWPYNTAAWQRLRRAKLAETPLCEPCERRGDIVAANTVDHRVSISSGGEAFPSLAGLMSMCHACHNTKTAAVDRAGGKGVRFKGCDVNGLPIDDAHPFLSEGDTPSKDGKEGERDRWGT